MGLPLDDIINNTAKMTLLHKMRTVQINAGTTWTEKNINQ